MYVTKQPGREEMSPMTSYPNCPAGLEGLASVDHLAVKQDIDFVKVLCGCNMANKYSILTNTGQELFTVEEETPCCTRMCCGSCQPFELRVIDSQNRDVLHLSRPIRGQGCFFPCFLQEMTVTAPTASAILGYVKEEWTILVPTYRVENANNDAIFKVVGPILHCSCCNDVQFNVYNYQNESSGPISTIRKNWSGCLRECCTDSDFFNINFPENLDPTLKGLLLGTIFLIDFMYYEFPRNHILCN